MKELFVIRHAKSSWSNPNLKDIDRPLNSRGKRDAPNMAAYLKTQNHIPNLLISSPAKRAQRTANQFSQAFYGQNRISTSFDLYYGTSVDYLNVIQELDNKIQSVAIFGHNPMITDFVNQFTNDWIDNVPTCGVVCIQKEIEQWNEFVFDNNGLKFYFFPKALFY